MSPSAQLNTFLVTMVGIGFAAALLFPTGQREVNPVTITHGDMEVPPKIYDTVADQMVAGCDLSGVLPDIMADDKMTINEANVILETCEAQAEKLTHPIHNGIIKHQIKVERKGILI